MAGGREVGGSDDGERGGVVEVEGKGREGGEGRAGLIFGSTTASGSDDIVDIAGAATGAKQLFSGMTASAAMTPSFYSSLMHVPPPPSTVVHRSSLFYPTKQQLHHQQSQNAHMKNNQASQGGHHQQQQLMGGVEAFGMMHDLH